MLALAFALRAAFCCDNHYFLARRPHRKDENEK